MFSVCPSTFLPDAPTRQILKLAGAANSQQSVTVLSFFHSAPGCVQASRAQKMMGRHEQMIGVVPTSLHSAFLRLKRLQSFPRGPTVKTCRTCVTQHGEIVQTATSILFLCVQQKTLSHCLPARQWIHLHQRGQLKPAATERHRPKWKSGIKRIHV